MKTILLIDADLAAYASARYPKIYDPEGFARTEEQVEANAESWLHNLLYELEEKYGITADYYKLFLEGTNNFRSFIYPQYKAHRRQREKPPMLQYAREYLKKHYNAWICEGVESDDVIAATWYKIITDDKDARVIICSMDRDLRALPCEYFNTHHKIRELTSITKVQANYNFYKSMLVGDKEDNIEGLHAIGDIKADKILAGLTTRKQMLIRVYREYIKHYGRLARRKFELNYLLLKLIIKGVNIPTEFEEINF